MFGEDTTKMEVGGLEAKMKSGQMRLRKLAQKASEWVIVKRGEWSGCPERLPVKCHNDELSAVKLGPQDNWKWKLVKDQ